jgi:hypothetical protein
MSHCLLECNSLVIVFHAVARSNLSDYELSYCFCWENMTHVAILHCYLKK